jgi:hypothetical protein
MTEPRQSLGLLSVQLLAPDRRLAAAALAIRVVAPVGLTAILGAGLAFLLSLPLTATSLAGPPIGFLAAVATGVIVSGLAACRGAGRPA